MKCKKCNNDIKESDVNCPHCGYVLKKNENIFKGILGALIGSLAGVVLIVLLAQIGFVASVSGLVMAYAAVYMYEKFAGSISIKGIIACIVIMLIMTFFGVTLAVGVQIAKEYDVTVLTVLKYFFPLLNTVPELKTAFIQDLLMILAFNALGCFSIFKSKINIIKNK